jgi:hypothetical protein
MILQGISSNQPRGPWFRFADGWTDKNHFRPCVHKIGFKRLFCFVDVQIIPCFFTGQFKTWRQTQNLEEKKLFWTTTRNWSVTEH